MRETLKMRQFRSREDDYQRWRAIRLPFGDQDFSTVVRHALNELYRQLVVSKAPADNGFKGVKYRPCEDCHALHIVDQSDRCAVCYLIAYSNGKIKRASELGTTPGPTAAPAIGAAPPKGKRSTKPSKQGSKAPPANGSPRRPKPKGRKARKGGE